MIKTNIKRIDLLLAWSSIFFCIGFLIVLSTKQSLDFDSAYNMLSYQNLFNGKGFTHTYDGNTTYFNPVISTGPELYLPMFLLWLIQGKTDYFAATYVLIAYYAVFLLFLNFYVLKNQNCKFFITFILASLIFCTSQLFNEYVIINPKGEPVAAILLFIGLYLLKERKHPIIASLLLAFALNVKPNIIVALIPCVGLLFYFEYFQPEFKTKNISKILKISALLGCYGILILLPYLTYSKVVPFVVLSDKEWKTVSEERKQRSKMLLSKGFGHIGPVIFKANKASVERFINISIKKYIALKSYYNNSKILLILYFCTFIFFLTVSFKIKHFSFYLFLLTVFILLWWLLCPISIWYRYYALVDYIYIFAATTLISALAYQNKKVLVLSSVVLVCMIYFPRFSYGAINKHFSYVPEGREAMFKIQEKIKRLDENQIFTYGWFQAPQIMLLTNKRFNNFHNKKKLLQAKQTYGEIYFLETIENNSINSKMEELRGKLDLIYSFGYNHLYKIPLEPPKKGQHINFTKNMELAIYDGWYGKEGPAERKYRWTQQFFSTWIPANTKCIKLWALTPDEKGLTSNKTLTFSFEDESLGHVVLRKSNDLHLYQIRLEKEIFTGGIGYFKLNYYFCPNELGKSADMRKLGIAITKMKFLKNECSNIDIE